MDHTAIVASLTPDQVKIIVSLLVSKAQESTPDEQGLSDAECEDYWSAHEAGEIEFAREVLDAVGVLDRDQFSNDDEQGN
jgi:hypothetical protein